MKFDTNILANESSINYTPHSTRSLRANTSKKMSQTATLSSSGSSAAASSSSSSVIRPKDESSTSSKVKISFGPSRPPTSTSRPKTTTTTSSGSGSSGSNRIGVPSDGTSSSRNATTITAASLQAFENLKDFATLKHEATSCAATTSNKSKERQKKQSTSSNTSNNNHNPSNKIKKTNRSGGENGLPCSEAEMKALMNMFVEIMGMSMETDNNNSSNKMKSNIKHANGIKKKSSSKHSTKSNGPNSATRSARHHLHNTSTLENDNDVSGAGMSLGMDRWGDFAAAAAAAASMPATAATAATFVAEQQKIHGKAMNNPMVGLFTDGVGAASWEAIRRTYGRSLGRGGGGGAPFTAHSTTSSNHYRHDVANMDYGDCEDDYYEDDDCDDHDDNDVDTIPELRHIMENEHHLQLLQQHFSLQQQQKQHQQQMLSQDISASSAAAAAAAAIAAKRMSGDSDWESIRQVLMDANISQDEDDDEYDDDDDNDQNQGALEDDDDERSRKATKRKEKKQRKKQKQKEEAAKKAAEAAQKKRDKAFLSWRSRVISAVQSNDLIKLESLIQESPLARNIQPTENNNSDTTITTASTNAAPSLQTNSLPSTLSISNDRMLQHVEFLLPNAVAKNRNHVDRGKDARARLTQYLLTMDIESLIVRPLRNGRAAFHTACFYGDVDFVVQVLDKVVEMVPREIASSLRTRTTIVTDDATVNTTATTTSSTTITEMTNTISDLVNLNQTCDDSGWSPLHYAVVSGSMEIFEELLLAGCDLSTITVDTNTWRESDGKGITAKELARYVHSGEYEQTIESHGVALQEMENAFFSTSSDRQTFLKFLEQVITRLDDVESKGYSSPKPTGQDQVGSVAGSEDDDKSVPQQQQQSLEQQQQQETAAARKRKKKKKKKEAQKQKGGIVERSNCASNTTTLSSAASTARLEKVEEDPMVEVLLGMGFARDQIMAAAKACGGINRATADDLVAWIFGQDAADDDNDNGSSNRATPQQPETKDDNVFEVNEATVVKASEDSAVAEAKRLEEEARKKEEAAQRLAAKRAETRRRNREWNNREQARQQEAAKARMANAIATQQRAPVLAQTLTNDLTNSDVYPTLHTGLPHGLQTGVVMSGIQNQHQDGAGNGFDQRNLQPSGRTRSLPVMADSSNLPQFEQVPRQQKQCNASLTQQQRPVILPSKFMSSMTLHPPSSTGYSPDIPTPSKSQVVQAGTQGSGIQYVPMRLPSTQELVTSAPHSEPVMLPAFVGQSAFVPSYGFPSIGDDEKTVSSHGSSRVSISSSSFVTPSSSIPPPGFRQGSDEPAGTSIANATSMKVSPPAISHSIEEASTSSSAVPPITTDINPLADINPLGEIRATAKAFIPANFKPPPPAPTERATSAAAGSGGISGSNMQIGITTPYYGSAQHANFDVALPSLTSFVDGSKGPSNDMIPAGMQQIFSTTELRSSNSFDHGGVAKNGYSFHIHGGGGRSSNNFDMLREQEHQQGRASAFFLDPHSSNNNTNATNNVRTGPSIWTDAPNQLGLSPPSSSIGIATVGSSGYAGLTSFSLGDVVGDQKHHQQQQHYLESNSPSTNVGVVLGGVIDGNIGLGGIGAGPHAFGGWGEYNSGNSTSNTGLGNCDSNTGNNTSLHGPPAGGSIW